MRARHWLVLVALLAGGCNQILGIHEGILDTSDAAADGGVSDAGGDGRDANAQHDQGPQDAAAQDDAAQDDGPKCAGQCGDPNCGSCPTATPMVSAGGGYDIDAHEVTNADYQAFLATNPDRATLQAGKCQWNVTFAPNPPINVDQDNLPVVGVNWCDAFVYCAWARKRLCGDVGGGGLAFAAFTTNSSQWYKACTPALNLGAFPYGLTYGQHTCNGQDNGVAGTVAVATMSGCVGGVSNLHDMSGNVAEWEDSCDGDTAMGDWCRIRGGSYLSSQANLKCAADDKKTRGSQDLAVGFRCCSI